MAQASVRIRMLTLATVTVAASVGTAFAVQAFNPQPEPPARWVVGLTENQTASLSVVNLAPHGTCEVSYTWLDADGQLLFSSTARVPAGTFDSHEFHPPEPVEPRSDEYGDVPPDDDRPQRFQVRPAVVPLNPGGSCDLATTLELFNNADGKTTAMIGNAEPRQRGRRWH